MVKLIDQSPCDGLLPISYGGVTLSEITGHHITSIAPAPGAKRALKTAHNLSWPAPNRMSVAKDCRAVWFDYGHIFLIGPPPDAALKACAMLTDQSDAWCYVSLEGAGGVDVLARLVPADLRAAHFKCGHMMRTVVGHMPACVMRTSAHMIDIMVFRSMAKTLVHELGIAMRSISAR